MAKKVALPSDKPKSTKSSLDPARKLMISKLLVLKGIAIIPVVGLHILSNIKMPLYWQEPWQTWVITFDQISRFCVPLFVALSGYTLMAKYGEHTGNLLVFWQRRGMKLLPVYVLWCFLITLAMWFVPLWQWPGYISNWLENVFWGHVDYHLYFVPMIFQLYLLFPILAVAVRWLPRGTVVLAATWHVLFLKIIITPALWYLLPATMITDQQQYIFFGTWVFYFVLGMAAAKLEQLPPAQTVAWSAHVRKLGVMTVLTVLTLGWAVTEGKAKILTGIDPIVAMKFTRFSAAAFATSFVTLSLLWLNNGGIALKKIPSLGIWWRPLIWLGTVSYLVYLSHTLALRIIYGYHYGLVSWQQLVAPSIILIIGLYISQKLKLAQ